MPFEPGHTKSGGRKQGTPNKKTLQVEELLEQMNCNPIRAMIELAMNEAIEPALKLSALKELSQYVYSKKRSSEVSVAMGEKSAEDLENDRMNVETFKVNLRKLVEMEVESSLAEILKIGFECGELTSPTKKNVEHLAEVLIERHKKRR